jgi:hypothetical protein
LTLWNIYFTTTEHAHKPGRLIKPKSHQNTERGLDKPPVEIMDSLSENILSSAFVQTPGRAKRAGKDLTVASIIATAASEVMDPGVVPQK